MFAVHKKLVASSNFLQWTVTSLRNFSPRQVLQTGPPGEQFPVKIRVVKIRSPFKKNAENGGWNTKSLRTTDKSIWQWPVWVWRLSDFRQNWVGKSSLKTFGNASLPGWVSRWTVNRSKVNEFKIAKVIQLHSTQHQTWLSNHTWIPSFRILRLVLG